MKISDGLFTLASVAFGGIVGALATGRATRLSARADAIDDFNLLRPLWSQNSNPQLADLTALQDRHIKLRGKLLVAGVPYSVLEWYESATMAYLGLYRQPAEQRAAMEADPDLGGGTFDRLSDFAFASDRLINYYLQRPVLARLGYPGWALKVKGIRLYVLANRPAM